MDRKWWTLIAVCTGVFMLLLDITIVNVALPDIQQAFDASLVGSAVGDRRVRADAGRVPAHRRLDRRPGRPAARVRGRDRGLHRSDRRCAASPPDATFLALARALQGVGGAIMFATSLALLAEAFRPEERGVAFGVFGAVTGVAVAVGPVLGGALTSGLSWRWIFFVNLPIGIAGAPRDAAARGRVQRAAAPAAPTGPAS